jgi:hypothetical protein
MRKPWARLSATAARTASAQVIGSTVQGTSARPAVRPDAVRAADHDGPAVHQRDPDRGSSSRRPA